MDCCKRKMQEVFAARELYCLNCSLLAKQIFYLCSCSPKNGSARHARECSQRPFVTPTVNKQSGISNDSNVEPCNIESTEQISNVILKVNKESDISAINNQSGTSKKSTVNKQSSGTKNKQSTEKGAVAGTKAGRTPQNVNSGTPRPKSVVESSLAEGRDFQSVQGSKRPATESHDSEEDFCLLE